MKKHLHTSFGFFHLLLLCSGVLLLVVPASESRPDGLGSDHAVPE